MKKKKHVLLRDYIPLSTNPSITLLHLVKTVWYSEASPEDFSNWLSFCNTAVTTSKSEFFFPTTLLSSEVIVSFPMFSRALGYSCYPASLNHSPFSPHLFLTDAPGYLVVVAPGTVWLADCGRQLFGGEPVTAVAKVGHPCADRVISGEHTSIHWRDGHTAWHSCRWEKDNWLNMFMCSSNESSAEQHLIKTGIAGWRVIQGKVRFLGTKCMHALKPLQFWLYSQQTLLTHRSTESTGGINCTNDYCIQFSKSPCVVHVSWNSFLEQFMEMMSSTCALLNCKLARSPWEEF